MAQLDECFAQKIMALAIFFARRRLTAWQMKWASKSRKAVIVFIVWLLSLVLRLTLGLFETFIALLLEAAFCSCAGTSQCDVYANVLVTACDLVPLLGSLYDLAWMWNHSCMRTPLVSCVRVLRSTYATWKVISQKWSTPFVPKAKHFASAVFRAKVILWRLGAAILLVTTFFPPPPFQLLLQVNITSKAGDPISQSLQGFFSFCCFK